MIERADVDRLDFGCKKITDDCTHMVITNEDKCQTYVKLDCKTKIVYSKTLYKYGDMIGLKWY